MAQESFLRAIDLVFDEREIETTHMIPLDESPIEEW